MATVAVDAPAPGFALDDFRGGEVQLTDLYSETHVVLVFNRGFS